LFVFSASIASAEPHQPGDGPGALPAIYRLGIVDSEQHRITFAGFFGYGYTEGIFGDEDRHHRIPMALSVSYRPLSWLALGYTHEIRYDRQQGGADDGDDGWVLEPRIRLRGGWVSSFGLRLGAEVDLWLPASDSQAAMGAGASFDATALFAYQPGELPLIIAGQAGFRLDRSAVGASNADALSLADRLTLGVSDSNALLVGLGVTWLLGPVELLGEWTWDVNLGDEAPDVGESPMRATLGARLWPVAGLQVSLIADVALSGRPPVAQGAPLVAVEPRFTVTAGLTYRIGFTERVEAAPPRRRESLRGLVVAPDGTPLAGAAVHLEGPREPAQRETDAQGRFELELPRRGELTLRVQAEGFESHQETLTVAEVGEAARRIELTPLPAALQGRATMADGTPVGDAAVQVTIGELQREGVTDAEGRFVVEELPAGSAEVVLQATGFRTSTTGVQLERGETAEVAVQLDQGLPEGQLQGTVRAMDGTPLQAFVLISGERTPHQTAEDGTFELSVAPGRYELRIGLRGYVEVRRAVVVEENGVVMLNVDLRPARRRRQR
jgi:hypothetical protein